MHVSQSAGEKGGTSTTHSEAKIRTFIYLFFIHGDEHLWTIWIVREVFVFIWKDNSIYGLQVEILFIYLVIFHRGHLSSLRGQQTQQQSLELYFYKHKSSKIAKFHCIFFFCVCVEFWLTNMFVLRIR